MFTWITLVALAAEPATFTGLVQGVTPLDGVPHLPVDPDPRFALTVLVLDGTLRPPLVAGAPTVFGLHSPSRTFAGDPAVGAIYRFDLSVDDGVVAAFRVAPLGPTLPAPSTSCTVDTDCALARVHLDGPWTCCPGCGTVTAGTTAWVADVDAACLTEASTRACYPLACPMVPTVARCVEGRCASVMP